MNSEVSPSAHTARGKLRRFVLSAAIGPFFQALRVSAAV